MQRKNPWPGRWLRLILAAVTAFCVGLLLGQPWLVLGLFALLLLVWQLYQLQRLERWLALGGGNHPPEGSGAWGDVFETLHRNQKRQRRRRHELTRMALRFKQTADAVPDAAVVLGAQGELQRWNETAERLLGLRWPQDAGQRIDNLFRSPELRAFLERPQAHKPMSFPSPLRHGAVLELRIAPYGEGERLLLARDITRLQRLEGMRRDFVANVSHELRTPLTVIHGLAEMLSEEAEDNPMTARALELMGQQTERMRQLVDRLLMFSRLETDAPPRPAEPVAVARLLAALHREAQALGAAHHQIEFEVDKTLGLLGDETELRSAFSNLIGNALKYTPKGGRICVGWAREADGARFWVSDNGPGISPALLPRLTERFFRVDSARSPKSGGFGLGLAIVKHVLNRHEGRLDIDSRLGAGSRFSCLFAASRVVALPENSSPER